MTIQAQGSFAKLSAEKKKLAVMACLLTVGLLMWGRLLLLHRQPRQAVADTVAVAASDETSGSAKKVVRFDLPKELNRDLFALDSSGYERVPVTAAPVVVNQAPVVEKSVDHSADESARVASIRQAAGELRLQSTLQGDRPRAVINGLSLAKGQVIKGFVLVKIEARHVIVERDGVEICLEM
ncbi:MAG: hypothetical protein NTW19_18870 [Planctomycetota bacterium]|nr:hypothetical protein [Planctomycetota bacterium]